MDEYCVSNILGEPATSFDSDLMRFDNLNEYQGQAPYMGRGYSGSSMDSSLSAGPSTASAFADSPFSSLGSPQSDGDLLRRTSNYEQPHDAFLSPDATTLSRESSAGLCVEPDTELPPFDIAKDGNPDIKWIMYYDFIVTKTEAFFQLQRGYIPGDEYPARRSSETVIVDGEKRHPCGVPNCKAKPFTRHYDLERHFATVHRGGQGRAGKEQGSKDQIKKVNMNCDYKRCTHTDPLRKDHCREHYREYHNEDLIKRNQPKHSKLKHGKKKPQTVQQFLDARIGRLDLSWFRCSKCMQRVYINQYKYTCPGCGLDCEPERVACRENARKLAENTSGLGSTQMNYVTTACGQ